MATTTDELERLAGLRDRGALTPEEFDVQKARVLGGQPSAPAPRKTFRLGRVLLITAGVLIALFVLLMVIAVNSPTPVATSPVASGQDQTVKAMAVTPGQLAKAYEDNEAAAQRDYGGRPLFVMATVSGINLDIVDNPFILLRDPDHLLDVQASLVDGDKPKAADLHKGQKINLLCQDVSEVVAVPMLKDCSIRTGADTNVVVNK